jgi:hypothetical protein
MSNGQGSPLLQEYMRTHPVSPNDSFKLIFERYSGMERGGKVLEEIKRRLGAHQGESIKR